LSLRKEAVIGFSWSFVEGVVGKLIQLFVGIYIARMLSPEAFGIVGISLIIINIIQPLVESGLTAALIQKQDAKEIHNSTVFYYNLFIALIIYAGLYFSAKSISIYFQETELTSVIKVLGLTLIISAFGAVQNAILFKKLNFKVISKASIASNVISGAAGIYLAYLGYGVWSLVYRNLLQLLLYNIFITVVGRWIPSFIFSFKELKLMFSFGFHLLLSSIINAVFGQGAQFVIAKFYSPISLGFYSRAELMGMAIPTTLSNLIEKVSFPILSKIQNNDEKLKSGLSKLIQTGMVLSFFLVGLIYVESDKLVLFLLGEDWNTTAEYLEIVCFAFVLHPLHSINLSILKVKARTDYYLRVELIKKITLIPLIILGVFSSINSLLWLLVLHSVISYIINTIYSNKVINYGLRSQLIDLLKPLIVALIPIIVIHLIKDYFTMGVLWKLAIEFSIATIIFVTLAKVFRLEFITFLTQLIRNKIDTSNKTIPS